jgi:amino acid permease
MLLLDKQLKMNAPFTVNNIIIFNAIWCGFWVVELITDPLKLHAFDFGLDRTPIEAQGWRAAACFSLGLCVMCIWALKLPIEFKKSFLQCLIAPYFASLLWLINDRDIYYTRAWNAHIIIIGLATILTFVGGFVMAPERIVPLKKNVVIDSGVEVSRVHAA